MATISENTFVTNFNADGQQSNNIKLMTDERGHMYPFSHMFTGNATKSEMAVTPSTSSGLFVNITAGFIQVPFSDYAYLGWLGEDTELQIDAFTNEGARYVAVVAYIDRDIQYDASATNNPGLLKIKEVDGATGTSPTEVSDKAISDSIGKDNPFVVLAQIYLPAGATAISASNIIDKRAALSLKDGVGLPSDGYAAGVKEAAGSSKDNNLRIAVISANETVPTGSNEYDLLVCRISQ